MGEGMRGGGCGDPRSRLASEGMEGWRDGGMERWRDGGRGGMEGWSYWNEIFTVNRRIM